VDAEAAVLRVELAGGRRLRPLHDADAPELHALIERNRARLARWIHWAREQSSEDTLAFIGKVRAKEQEGSGLSRGILLDDRLAGVVEISIDKANRSAALGYWLDEAAEGKGLVTAAVAALAHHGFERWQLVRLEIRADVDNRASRAVAERLGFTYEGTLRQAYHVTGERYSDDAVYSMLASEASALLADAR
jgi:ribosomal-protein-serine acetyltransferase